MRRTFANEALVLAAVLVLGACEGATEQPPPAEPETFTYASRTEVMVGWDPATQNSNSVKALANVYETLTYYNNETQELEPMLATEWSSSADGLEWTFTLQPDVTFHTGRTMTAEDVKASIDRTIELEQGASYIWAAVKSIEAPDPQTVVFNLKYSAPLDLVASAAYAAYIYDTQVETDGMDLDEWFEEGNEAGTGPYMLDTWNSGQEVELRLNAYPSYWRDWEGPYYEHVVFRVTPEATTAAQLLRSGEVSFVERLTPQLIETFQDDPNTTTTSTASWQTLIALLNTTDGPLADQRVREAVVAGIQYEGITQALQGSAEPLSGLVPPGLWGHVDDMYPTYDPETAASLLGEAGYGPDGDPMSLELTYVAGDSDEETFATLTKSNLADLNIDVDARGMQWGAQWAKGKSAKVEERQDIFVMYWWPDYADPSSWFSNLFRSEDPPFFNLSYYSNPQIDKQIEEAALLAASDREAATQVYEDMQATLFEDAPSISVYTQTYQRAMLSTFGGYVDNPAYANVVFVYDLTPGAA